MYSLKVENNRGDLLDLTASDRYTVYKIAGLNPPKATINNSVNATTDGTNINSTRLESRNIVLYLTVNGEVEANRINLYKYFPVKKSVKLYFSNGSRNVYIEGVVELIECDMFTRNQRAQISIICPKPYFKDVEDIVMIFSDIKELFQFPFAIESTGIELSSSTINTRKSVVNVGDVETGAILQLFATGTVVNPVIYNVLTGTYFRLNFTMLSSDTIVINTNVGEKSVTLIRSGVSYNAMGYMDQGSNWFVLDAGDNVFTYNADSGNANLQITFTTSILYSGV